MVTRVRLKWRLRLIIYLPTMPQLGVEDHMYQGVAAAYLFDSPVQTFIQEKNPWALRDMEEGC